MVTLRGQERDTQAQGLVDGALIPPGRGGLGEKTLPVPSYRSWLFLSTPSSPLCFPGGLGNSGLFFEPRTCQQSFSKHGPQATCANITEKEREMLVCMHMPGPPDT